MPKHPSLSATLVAAALAATLAIPTSAADSTPAASSTLASSDAWNELLRNDASDGHRWHDWKRKPLRIKCVFQPIVDGISG